jgi:hypothetical protein
MPDNPYAPDLAGRDPLAAMREALEAVEALAARFDATAWERSYAPGKWTARQLLVHLAQVEQFFGTRVRLALTTRDFVVQPMEQDDTLGLEGAVSGPRRSPASRGSGACISSCCPRSRPASGARASCTPSADRSRCGFSSSTGRGTTGGTSISSGASRPPGAED